MSNGTVEVPTKKPFLSDAQYEALKYVALVILPALGTLYFAMAGLWGLPAATQVVGTIVALDTFLGVVLKVSTAQYEKNTDNYHGTVGLVDYGGDVGEKVKFDVLTDPNTLTDGKQVVFKVVPKHAAPYDEQTEDEL